MCLIELKNLDKVYNGGKIKTKARAVAIGRTNRVMPVISFSWWQQARQLLRNGNIQRRFWNGDFWRIGLAIGCFLGGG